MIKYILLYSILLSGCEKANESSLNPSFSAKTILNLAYGNDPQQKMDVYLPNARTVDRTKVIVMIHGGGWSTGDKKDFSSYVDTLKRRLPDYAIFNINYRLSTGTKNQFPTQENDVKAALDFILNKTEEYNISKKIVLMGASAGAHLALLQGYKYTSPQKVRAVIDFFGPVDLVDLYNNSPAYASQTILEMIIGATPTTDPVLFEQSSPINFVSQGSPPTIIFQGGADPLVSAVTQSGKLDSKLQLMGVDHEFIIYPSEGHGWAGPHLADSFDKLEEFLRTRVN